MLLFYVKAQRLSTDFSPMAPKATNREPGCNRQDGSVRLDRHEWDTVCEIDSSGWVGCSAGDWCFGVGAGRDGGGAECGDGDERRADGWLKSHTRLKSLASAGTATAEQTGSCQDGGECGSRSR